MIHPATAALWSESCEPRSPSILVQISALLPTAQSACVFSLALASVVFASLRFPSAATHRPAPTATPTTAAPPSARTAGHLGPSTDAGPPRLSALLVPGAE